MRSNIEITPLSGSDTGRIRALLEGTKVFRPEEIEVALEVVGQALGESPASGYIGAAARDGRQLLGFACWGPTPCTRGTFDLYWIAVDATAHGQGIGRMLTEHSERDMRSRGGRLCIVETSGLPIYDATRAFYRRLGYLEQARIPDYYQDGDDLVIYTRRL